MKKYFYSHLVEFNSLIIDLEKIPLSNEEKNHLISLAESNLHCVILDAILSELSEDDKKAFLEHLSSNDHDQIWSMLKIKTQNIEEKIKKTAEDIKKQLHKDIEEIKINY